jgi:ABC-type transport system involved in multi-copper enzyme maturation permease subunit
MNVSGIWGVLSLTFKETIRAKWLILFSIIFFLLAIDIPDLLANQTHILPPQYLASFLGVLVTISFPIIPLLSLPMSATSIVDDREMGTLQYILSNPISKSEFFLGRTAGLLLSTTLALVLGFGGASIFSYTTNVSQYSGIIFLITFAVMLNMSMVGLGFVISNFSKRKVTALAFAIFAWLMFTVLSSVDSLAVVLNLEFGVYPALSLVFLDPVEMARILAAVGLGLNDAQWGSLGLLSYDIFGSSMQTVLLAGLSVWILVMLAASFLVFRHQDLG